MSRTAKLVVALLLSIVLISGSAPSVGASSPAGPSSRTTLGANGRPAPTPQQAAFTIEEILAPGYPFELISAKKADRIAWIAFEHGMRNVYTAAATDFEAVRLTSFMHDDGNDLSSLRISDDGSMIVFVRGHAPNRDGWVANPTSDPRGGERSVWAIRNSGGEPWKVAVGANPALSSDGRWVLVARDGQIYRYPVPRDQAMARNARPGDDQPLFLAHGNNSNPVWSPDGRRIAFVSNRGDHSFIGVYDADKPEVIYLAPGVDYDSNPAWSPDGRRVAFIRRPGRPFGAPAGGGRGGRGGRGGFRGQGQGGPADGLRRAAFGGGYTLAFWVADVEITEGQQFWHSQPGDNSFQPRDFQWADQNVIFQAEPGNWRHVFSVPVPPAPVAEDEEPQAGGRGGGGGGRGGGRGGFGPPQPVEPLKFGAPLGIATSLDPEGSSAAPINLTPGEGIAEYYDVSSDGRYLFYAINVGDIDRRHIWRTPTAGGEPVQLTRGDEIETYPVALASGDRFAVLSASYNRPLSVAISANDSPSADLPRVIFPELGDDFPLAEQVVPENVMLTAADGVEFHNQLFLPRDIQPGERRPAMLFTHGGPSRQMLLGYHYMHFYHMAYAINQYFASQGYVTISVNYRSGIGYGREFRTAPNTGGRGNSEYQDVLAAGQYLQSRPDVDPERIGLWGLSYGGILTAQGLARNSDIFSAGVDIAGVHLRGSSVEPDDISYQSSAIGAIDTWRSPVLLIHGDDDRNVAFSQTVGLVQLLRAKDVYHELMVLPDDVHDSLIFDRWLMIFNATDDFFQRLLLDKELTQQ